MRWLRRFLYFLLFTLWLIVMFFPCTAFMLAMEQQIQIGDSEGRHIRIFLLQEPDNEGIGLEWKRPFPSQPDCFKTTVNYMMWAGTGENVTFCQCYDSQSKTLLTTTPGSCK